MIPSCEQMGICVQDVASRFPDSFFVCLDGGIPLDELPQPEPGFPLDDVYTMGEHVSDSLAPYILLYCGSFADLLADSSEEEWKDGICATPAREFIHHMCETAGPDDLDELDETFLQELRDQYG